MTTLCGCSWWVGLALLTTLLTSPPEGYWSPCCTGHASPNPGWLNLPPRPRSPLPRPKVATLAGKPLPLKEGEGPGDGSLAPRPLPNAAAPPRAAPPRAAPPRTGGPRLLSILVTLMLGVEPSGALIGFRLKTRTAFPEVELLLVEGLSREVVLEPRLGVGLLGEVALEEDGLPWVAPVDETKLGVGLLKKGGGLPAMANVVEVGLQPSGGLPSEPDETLDAPLTCLVLGSGVVHDGRSVETVSLVAFCWVASGLVLETTSTSLIIMVLETPGDLAALEEMSCTFVASLAAVAGCTFAAVFDIFTVA